MPTRLWASLPLAAKIALTFAVLVLLAAAGGGVAIWSLNELQAAWDHEISLAAANRQAGQLALAIKSMQEIPTDYMAVGNVAARDDYARARARAIELLENLAAGGIDVEEQRLWEEVRRQVARLDRAAAQALRLDPAVGNPAGPALMKELDGAFENGAGALDRLIERRAARAALARRHGLAVNRAASMAVAGGAALVIVTSLVLGGGMLLGLVPPLRALQLAAEAVASGDLTVRVRERSRDELGRLSSAFNAMVEQTAQALGAMSRATETLAESSGRLQAISAAAAQAAREIAEATGQVAGGAAEQSRSVGEAARVVEELRRAVEQIAKGAEEQARNVHLTSSAVQDMARSIDEVAATANGVAAASVQASAAARSGSEVVELAVAGMGRVREAVLDSARRMQELDRHSARIGEIIAVITDLAQQTNLLALNAAIEAARAGAHGRGFAVVAEEVRKLADRSSASAGEVGALIRSIQEGTQNAVRAMQRGTAEAEEGSRLAGEAGRALAEILRSVEQTSQGVQRISAAAQQIAAASRQVVGAVDSVAAVTEQNTAATEEMAAGADQVAESMNGVASVSRDNAATAERVSASIREVTALTAEISASADSLAEVARELRTRAARFRFSDSALGRREPPGLAINSGGANGWHLGAAGL